MLIKTNDCYIDKHDIVHQKKIIINAELLMAGTL